MQLQEFPSGNYYMIINKASQLALRMQENDPSHYQKSKIVGQKPNPQDNNQLFMVEKVGNGDDQIEIINCISTFILSQDSSDVKVKYGKRSKDQLFSIKHSHNQGSYRYFWIHTDTKAKKAMSLENTLKINNFDANNPCQLFRFEQVGGDRNNILAKSSIIVNNHTGKVIDVPKASRKPIEKIVQWDKSKRWNQRWAFMKQKNGLAIMSVINGMNLDICGESKKSGADIIQFPSNGGNNQLWIAQSCGNGLYKFKSVHEPSLFLSIRKQSMEKGAQLEASTAENPTMYWRVQGLQPSQVN